jgi:hypothetical protein
MCVGRRVGWSKLQADDGVQLRPRSAGLDSKEEAAAPELPHHHHLHPIDTRLTPRYHRSLSSLAMSLDPPTIIFQLQNNIRARPISWEGAVRAKTITDADLKKIKSIDKVRKEQRKTTIESDVDSYVTLLLGGSGSQSIFEAAAKRQDIIQYMLVLTGDLIDGMFRVLLLTGAIG